MKKKLYVMLTAAVLVIAFLFALASCGSEGVSRPDEYIQAPSSDDATNVSAETPEEYAAKVIRDFTVRGEVKDFDTAKDTVEAKMTELGGFMQSMNISGGKSYSGKEEIKSGYFSICVPSAKVDEFIAAVEAVVNVTSAEESARDVSTQYAETASRVSKLQARCAELEEIMEQNRQQYRDYMFADKARDPQPPYTPEVQEILQNNFEGWLAYSEASSELYNIQSELQQYEPQLSNLDAKTSFSNVQLSIEEVTLITPENANFFVRFGTAFVNGFSNFWLAAREVLIVLAWCISFFGIPTILVLCLIFFIKWNRIRKRQKALRKAHREAFDNPPQM